MTLLLNRREHQRLANPVLDNPRNIRRQRFVAHLHAAGARPTLDAMLEVEQGKPLDEVLKRAEHVWRTSAPLAGTLGWKYFTERRGLHVGLLDDLSHALRWHEGDRAVIALMTDPLTNKPMGIHRTFLNPDGTKLERKMLGTQGVIRLSRDGEVTMGLGITEGIEDGLAVLLSGWAPVWAATSAGAIKNFPVLPGIECLTVFADDGEPGMEAAQGVCRSLEGKGG